MKKILAVCSVCCILLFACAPFAFAQNNLTDPKTACFWFAEPSYNPSVFYLALVDNTSPIVSDVLNFGIMWAIYIPGCTQDALDSGRIHVYATMYDRKITVQILSDLYNHQIIVCSYNGTSGSQSSKTIYNTDNTGYIEFDLTVPSQSPSTNAYWYKGCIDIIPNSLKLANLIFIDDFQYLSLYNEILNQLSTIYSELHTLYGTVDATYSEVNDIDSFVRDIYTYLTTTFAQAFNAFYTRNHSDLTTINASLSGIRAELLLIETKLDTANNNLSQIRSYLYEIKNLLGSGEVITTIPPDTQLSDEVSNYHEEESQYFDDFDDSLDSLDSNITFAENLFNTFTDSFSFIRVQFDRFTAPYGYIVLTISLLFGVIVLVLGRNA